jgi:MFS family permease
MSEEKLPPSAEFPSMSEMTLRQTRSAFMTSRLLGVPFWGMTHLLPIILYKDLHINPLQIMLIITLKPLSALFAPYWSQWIYRRPDRIISNLIWGNILRYSPFLFVPWVKSSWILIAAFGFYMVFHRGTVPTWLEIIKRNLPPLSREKIIGSGSTVDYCGTALLPLILGTILDKYDFSWQWLFPLTAVLGIISVIFLCRIPTPKINIHDIADSKPLNKQRLLQPWRNSWKLVKESTQFSRFQIGFMLGGAGLMIIQPALPKFFADTLQLSYTEMLFALTMCKGIGFAITMPFWVKFFRKWNIFYFSGTVTILASLFPIMLFSSQFNILFLYLAYLLYGVMQAGSDLSWNMSGSIFAKEEDSTHFSGTNILSVGIRGCFIPPLGAALLYFTTSSSVVMGIGALLCLLATRYLWNNRAIKVTNG